MEDELPADLIEDVVEEKLCDDVPEEKVQEIKEEVRRRMKRKEAEKTLDSVLDEKLVSRRRFLKLAGLGAGGLGLSSLGAADFFSVSSNSGGGGSSNIDSGKLANRPSPGDSGRLFMATDGQGVYYDTGSEWKKVSADADSGPNTSFSFSPADPAPGDSISFDASGTTNKGPVYRYRWDWTDDSNFEATGKTATHSFGSSGDYTIVMEAEDYSGNTGSSSKTITVNDIPTASYTFSPSKPGVGESITFDGSGSSDDLGISSYNWDWTNDGTYEGSGATPSHSFGSAGYYTVVLEVVDQEGKTDTKSKTITVNDPPTADFSFSPSNPTTSDSVSFDASSSTDDLGISNYRWDWTNDSNFEGSGQTASHSYGSTGDKTVVLEVEDDDGKTDTVQKTVTVFDPPIDDFDTNRIGNYNSHSARFIDGTPEIVSSPSISGSALRVRSDDTGGQEWWALESTSGLPNYPSAGDKFKVSFRFENSNHSAIYFYWAVQGSWGENFYYVNLNRDNKGDQAILYKLVSGSESQLDSKTYSITNQKWYDIIVDWGSGGNITVDVKDQNGNVQVSLSANDNSLSSGGVGIAAYDDAKHTTYWDEMVMIP